MGATTRRCSMPPTALKAMLERRGARVMVIVLPPGPEGSKQGLDDFRFAGGDLAALIAEAEETPSGILVAGSEAIRHERHRQRRSALPPTMARMCASPGSRRTDRGTPGPGPIGPAATTRRVQERAKQTMEALWTEAEAEPDPERQAELKKHAHKSNHRYPIASMLTLARSDSRIATRLDRFDRDPDLLNVANGVLDLRTGELRPHRPRRSAHARLRRLPMTRTPNARCFSPSSTASSTATSS